MDDSNQKNSGFDQKRNELFRKFCTSGSILDYLSYRRYVFPQIEKETDDIGINL